MPTTKVRIYRIECASCKCGPYRPLCTHRNSGCTGPMIEYGPLYDLVESMQFSHIDKDHPVPVEEFGVSTSYTKRCGFRTKAQLKRWFSKENLSLLKDAGFVCREFQVDSFDVTGNTRNKQVLYDTAFVHSGSLVTHSIDELMK